MIETLKNIKPSNLKNTGVDKLSQIEDEIIALNKMSWNDKTRFLHYLNVIEEESEKKEKSTEPDPLDFKLNGDFNNAYEDTKLTVYHRVDENDDEKHTKSQTQIPQCV